MTDSKPYLTKMLATIKEFFCVQDRAKMHPPPLISIFLPYLDPLLAEFMLTKPLA